MRILILSWKDPLDPVAGGAERYLLEVASRWVASGHQVTILGPRRRELPPQGAGTGDNGIRYLGVGSRLTVFRAAHRYLRHCGHRFDRVLESVSTRPFAAHRIVGNRAIALYHQTAEEVWRMEFPFPMSWVGEHVLEPQWVRRMRHARVVAVSSSTAAALRRFDVDTEAVIPPGCEPTGAAEKRVAPSAAPRLVWVGRLVRTKRPDDAIAAFARVREIIHGATLDLVGGGYLETHIRGEHHSGVTVHGFVPEVVKTSVLSQSDLLLLPGTREGWGIVALEAAAYGVPAVAYDIPGLRDAVLDGVTGMVVPSNPAAMGSAAASLLQDPDRWGQFSWAAQQRAREFTWDRVAQDLLCALRQPSGPTAEPHSLGSAFLGRHRPSCLPDTSPTSHPRRTLLRISDLVSAVLTWSREQFCGSIRGSRRRCRQPGGSPIKHPRPDPFARYR